MQNSCNVQHEHFYWLVTNMPQLSTSSWKKNVFLKLSVKICFIMVNGNWAETKVKESLSPPKIKMPKCLWESVEYGLDSLKRMFYVLLGKIQETCCLAEMTFILHYNLFVCKQWRKSCMYCSLRLFEETGLQLFLWVIK